MLSFCIFLSSIVSSSHQHYKTYWIECFNFPYDFIIQLKEPIDIYYIDKRMVGSESLTKEYDLHIQLKMDEIQNDLQIDSFPMYNYTIEKVQDYFHQIIQNIHPSMLFQLNDYIQHEFSLAEVKDWYQLLKTKPQYQSFMYPTLIIDGRHYLLNDHAIKRYK